MCTFYISKKLRQHRVEKLFHLKEGYTLESEIIFPRNVDNSRYQRTYILIVTKYKRQ